ncbi:hypothetical protein D9613_012783 [Agrocybe pediades]|uniref:Nephrocystin 3-like N-terminal domain-containing protein n=1 Tax=Agrocybe pediades TaxID=84607 RepID=A0A8H4R3S1_9AGAR|nr:hypothetical protein D9613_012783 [Agrocybe pediades]
MERNNRFLFLFCGLIYLFSNKLWHLSQALDRVTVLCHRQIVLNIVATHWLIGVLRSTQGLRSRLMNNPLNTIQMTQSGASVPPLINLSHSIVAGGTFTQQINQHHYNRSGERPGYARLLENVVTAAMHDSVDNVDPPKCHPNTRVEIMQNIRDWALGTDEELGRKPILWLKGGAGAGKSAIARSVAERCADEGLLLGDFFFKAADTSRNHVGNLVATISYQISTRLPEFRDIVSTIIEDSPLIFKSSIKTQLSTLIIRPLSAVLTNSSTTSSTTLRLIIIDGLDECSNVNSQRGLLITLQEVANATSLIRFLVCSRPESHLNSAFNLPQMVPMVHEIFVGNSSSAWNDIRAYLTDKFKEIKDGHSFKHMLPDMWPTPEAVTDLVSRSSGQFIYAATVVKYVESARHRPDQRLNAIFNLRPPFNDLPFMELDALYWMILSKVDDLPTVLDILAFPILYSGEFNTKDIEAMLQLEEGSVEILLVDLHSILTITPSRYVRMLHKSFADFLGDPERAGYFYRDLFQTRLSHIARVLSIYATHYWQIGNIPGDWWPFVDVNLELERDDIMKADYVFADILQASEQFPMFEYFTALLTSIFPKAQRHRLHHDQNFILVYFKYLYWTKDVCESTRLVYWEQIRQCCESVLAILDGIFSSNWDAHFTFVYYHVLPDPCYRLPWKLSYLHITDNIVSKNIRTFGATMFLITGMDGPDNSHQYCEDITRMFHDLMGNGQKEAIFAKSACFCLAVLCDEQRAIQDADPIYGIARHDRLQKREHPWHWRQMVPSPGRAPTLGNRLALVRYVCPRSFNHKLKLTRVRKVLRTAIGIQVITMHEYFKAKSQPVPEDWRWLEQFEQPQQWTLFFLLLELLPRILPLAGRYEPLVAMCRKKSLSSLSMLWPKKSRRARQAIEGYLRRMHA